MRSLITLMERAGDGAKIDESAFLYLAPRAPKSQFAQCNTCGAFMPKSERCSLFSKSFKVVANASCGLYVHGEPSEDQEPLNAVTPKEAGYVKGQVRCENCSWFDADNNVCKLFRDLNKKLPGVFNLEEKVDPLGCCNAWQK